MSLTQRDTELIVFAFQCFKDIPKVDYEKLAELANFKNAAVATAQYSSLKKKLANMAGGAGSTGENPTPKATPQKGKTNANATDPTTPTPKKTKAKTPKSTIKAEETTVKAEETTVQAEETTDTNAAGDADNEDSAVPNVSATVSPTKKRARVPPKQKYDENGNVVPPKKRVTAAQKAAQNAANEAAQEAAAKAEAEAQEKQVQTEGLVARLLQAQGNGLSYAGYETAVTDAEILQESGNDADVNGEKTEHGDHEMTQDEQDKNLFDTSVYGKQASQVNDEEDDTVVDAEEA